MHKVLSLLKLGTTYKKILDRLTHLKILEAQINTCFRNLFLPGIFLICTFGNTIGAFFCITQGSASFGHFIFLVLTVESTVVILLFGTLCGVLNKRSKMLLETLSRCHMDGKLTTKLFVKMVKGTPPMKIRFGNCFIDILTPFVMVSFCIKNTVRLLLLQQ